MARSKECAEANAANPGECDAARSAIEILSDVAFGEAGLARSFTVL